MSLHLQQLPASLAPLRSLPAAKVSGLYVHVPFCFHKCHYCDFYSIPGQSPDRMRRYVDLILAEAAGWASRGPLVRLRTIFFGGGTPSLLPIDSMRRLLGGLRDRLDLSAVDEWTVECNPATVCADYAALLRAEGVDRLSFGAQSFNSDELRLLERHHRPEQVHQSIDIARSAGFRRINVDLIFAIPGQTMQSWSASLEAAINLGTEHISAYALTYEPNTPLAIKNRLGQIQPADENLELAMLHYTRQRLAAAGYGAYEISNFARPGEECRHNLLYWNGGNYIGLGPAAASHVDGRRWRNRPHLGEWEQAIAAGTLPATDVEQLSPQRRAGEMAMLQLRLASGVQYDQIAARTGFAARPAFAPTVDRLEKLGLVRGNSNGFVLTEQGIDVADSIAEEFVEAVLE